MYCLMYVRIVKSWTFWDFLLVEQFFLLVYKISKKNNTRTIIPLDDVTHGLLVTSKSRFSNSTKAPSPFPIV